MEKKLSQIRRAEWIAIRWAEIPPTMGDDGDDRAFIAEGRRTPPEALQAAEEWDMTAQEREGVITCGICMDNLITNIAGLIRQRELQWLHEKAHEMETILEVGSWKGKSAFGLLSGCKGTVWAVDHFRGSPLEINGAEREAQDGKIKDIFLQNVGHFSNLKLLEMDSLEAVKHFEEKSIDMIFIDGDHRLESVRQDLRAWYPICKKLFCGHDYDPPGHPGVVQAVDELGMDVIVGPDWMWSVRIK